MKHSELVLVVDRSGSMSLIASDMSGAMKEIIQKQKKSKEEVLVTYVRFDTQYEEVFHEKNIDEIDGFNLDPRGATALLDAIGKTINTFERRFNHKDEKDQPSKVLFIIITDGEENSSREFSREQAFEIIEKVKRDHDWGFTFIGANQDSISEGSSLGIARGSSLNFAASGQGVKKMRNSVSNYVSDYLSVGSASYDEDETKE